MHVPSLFNTFHDYSQHDNETKLLSSNAVLKLKGNIYCQWKCFQIIASHSFGEAMQTCGQRWLYFSLGKLSTCMIFKIVNMLNISILGYNKNSTLIKNMSYHCEEVIKNGSQKLSNVKLVNKSRGTLPCLNAFVYIYTDRYFLSFIHRIL